MNVPFAPAFLWPIPVVLVVGGIVFEVRRRMRRAGGVEASPAEGAAPRSGVRRWEWIVSFGLIALGLMWSLSLWKFSVPPVEGRVVELDSGAPISGVRFQRGLSRLALLGFLSTSYGGSTERAGLQVEARSDGEGRFRFPGCVALVPMGVWGLEGMTWVAYDEGHVPVSSPARAPGFFPLFPGLARPAMLGTSIPDQWRTETWGSDWRSVRFELKLKRKVTPEDWAEAFSRTRVLVQERVLPVEQYLKQAVGYVETHPLTEEMLLPLSELTERINRYVAPQFAKERCAILRALTAYCEATKTSERCRWASLVVSLRDAKRDCVRTEDRPQ